MNTHLDNTTTLSELLYFIQLYRDKYKGSTVYKGEEGIGEGR
jgi:hypothetical protein